MPMDWIPAITTSTLLAIAGWLARNLIATRLKSTVEHDFNVKLANLQDQLNAKSAEISAVREGVFTAMSGRQAGFDKRRLEAVDQIWAAATSLSSVKFVVQMLTMLKVDEIHKSLASGDRKIQNFVDSLAEAPEMSSFDWASASKARPFLTPMVWATYTALAAVAGHANTHWIALKKGMNAKSFTNDDGLMQAVKLALPLRSDYIEQYGVVAAYHLFEELENQLVAEIQRMLDGTDDDKTRAIRAAEIVALTRDLQSQAEKAAASEATTAAAAVGVAA